MQVGVAEQMIKHHSNIPQERPGVNHDSLYTRAAFYQLLYEGHAHGPSSNHLVVSYQLGYCFGHRH